MTHATTDGISRTLARMRIPVISVTQFGDRIRIELATPAAARRVERYLIESAIWRDVDRRTTTAGNTAILARLAG